MECCLSDLGAYVLDYRNRLGIKVVTDINESQSGYLFAFLFPVHTLMTLNSNLKTF